MFKGIVQGEQVFTIEPQQIEGVVERIAASEHQLMKLRAARSVQTHNLSIEHSVVPFQVSRDGLAEFAEGLIFMAPARDQATRSVLDVRERTKPIEFDFVKPVRVVERFWSTRKAHRSKCGHPAHGDSIAVLCKRLVEDKSASAGKSGKGALCQLQ